MKKVLQFLAGVLCIGMLAIAPCQARLHQVVAKVTGVDCKYCGHGLSRLLNTIEGVSKVEVNIKKGLATLELSKQNNFDVARVEEKLKGSKFELVGLKLTASGNVNKQGQNYLFSVSKSPYKIYLHEADGPFVAHVKPSKGVMGKVKHFFTKMMGGHKNIEKKIVKLHDEKAPALLTCEFHQHRKHILGATGNHLKLSEIKIPAAMAHHGQA